ncbi:Rieske 2Fe-2S domain-containing protein [Sphingomonas changnyeongensis]|uniref:Rieske 2Fe-2S domain-containing protein n=1 Tax=Sphingomonas changnyeongensis TaxID=2698679 RepID=A0A7Z2NU21_9SPHN|nr:Rieske 2Fe-2S domain-containing protein [Sphingomonas changnyeongensis]QHL89858.1 Rieske 2Fe-2S domain-containing protein [Sphingomonas changnyeongensis]
MTDGTPPGDQPARPERLTATPPGIAVAALGDLADPGARAIVIEIGARRFHGFLVRRGGAVSGFVDRCPHMGLPLAQQLDQYLTPAGDLVACSWHGALFRPDDGACVAGPCAGQGLTPWLVTVADGIIRTA